MIRWLVLFLSLACFWRPFPVMALEDSWGFMPYWRVGGLARVDLVGKLFFFSVPVAKDGSLVWNFQSKRIFEKAFLDKAEKVRSRGGKVGVVFAMLKDRDLDKFLNDRGTWDKFYSEASDLEKKVGATMFNIDFEYQRGPTEILNDNYLEFLKILRGKIGGELSTDVFGNTLLLGDKEKIVKLMDRVDKLVFMGYDFNKPGLATPVAPASGMAGADLEDVYNRIEKLGLNKAKVVVALPLYGYEWRTVSTEFGSRLHPSSIRALASLGRMEQFLKNNPKVKVNYDEVTETPWLTYRVGKQTRQIYFENEKSLKSKVLKVKEKGFGAVAWWALGYEGTFDLEKVTK